MVERLTDTDVLAFLSARPQWRRAGDELVITVEAPSFLDAISLVNRVAHIAEEVNHHPDIDIRWRTVALRLTTHDAGGLTHRDTELAERIDAILDAGS